MKQYEFFTNTKNSFAEMNPELAFIVSGLSFENEAKVTLDIIHRYVVYYYDRNCELHSLHNNVDKARQVALGKFNIPQRVYESKNFINIESEMAKRYMLWNRDNEFSVYITISMQLEDLNHKIRIMENDTNMKENVDSLKVSNDIISLSEKIDIRKKSLFGEHQHIDRYAVQKEIINKYSAENGMI